MARLHTGSMPKLDRLLSRIQNDLFDLGSDLATPGDDPEGGAVAAHHPGADRRGWKSRSTPTTKALAPLTSFVLPGGTPLAAALHLARTVVRRAERLVVELIADGAGRQPGRRMIYLNRLSDLLFVMARVANANGDNDVLWTPGKFTAAVSASGRSGE